MPLSKSGQTKKPTDKSHHWIQLYIQAKLDGNKKLMDFYASLIVKTGGKVPK